MKTLAFRTLPLAWLLLTFHAFAQQPFASEAPAKPLNRITVSTPQGLQELLAYTGTPLPLVSSHRGGPQVGYPENCLETFEHTLQYTYSMLEIDPRFTKDGEIVIHHDPTLDRTTTGNGPIKDLTLHELKQLRLRDPEGKVTPYTIPTLSEALEWARGKAVLVLDSKDVTVAARVKKIGEHKAEAYAMLIVNSFKDAQTCYELNPNIVMEVMIPNHQKATEFDLLNIPWRNVIAFVGHNPPEHKELYDFIHSKGAMCMIGTSRNLDRQWLEKKISNIEALELGYRAWLNRGADIIETDIPVQLAPMLYGTTPIPDSRKKFFSIE